MATTIQQTLDFISTFIQYSPLSAGTGLQPALGFANQTQNTALNAPFTWGWNRAEDSTLSTVAGTQDYVVNLIDFSFLEKVTLTDPSGVVFEVADIYNTAALGKADASVAKRQRPNACAVISLIYGTSVKLRFMGVPDVIYGVLLTYQKLVTPLAALSNNWVFPDQYLDIYNNLMLAEALALVDDSRSQTYRTRGITALLSKAEGLTEMQKNDFLEQYWARNQQQTAGNLRTQQAAQARGV